MSTNDGFKGVSNCYVFKSRLQEYAQKVELPTPIYETIKEGPSHEPSFMSTVIVNDVRYDSLPGFFNRKAAEQSAAEVALMELANSGALDECISQPVHESGLCKNLLQEYAQKMNYAIPSYECHKEEKQGRVSLFTCTVEIGEIKYIGAAARTKKEAEIKAARTALLAIQSTGAASSEKPNGNSEYTVVPPKKKVIDLGINPQETAAALKPKKGRFKKKPRKKRRAGDEDNLVESKNLGNLEVNMDGKAGSELNPKDAFVVQVTDSGVLPVEATRNFQDENEGDLSATKGALAPFGNGQSKDVNLTALNFHQSELGSPNLGITSIICEGDLTALIREVNKVSGVGQVASMVNNSTMSQGEVPSGMDGLNQMSYGTDAGQTSSRTVGA